MRTRVATLVLCALAWLLGAPLGSAQPHDDKERAELAEALKTVKLPLERGVAASAKEGKPISAKYEIEEGRLQLSVYTMKGAQFSEVIVNHTCGKVVTAEPITKDDDLKAAREQSAAMTKAKRSLAAAAADAVKANQGFRVVSVTPSLRDDHPVADVMLMKGADWKTVAEKLD